MATIYGLKLSRRAAVGESAAGSGFERSASRCIQPSASNPGWADVSGRRTHLCVQAGRISGTECWDLYVGCRGASRGGSRKKVEGIPTRGRNCGALRDRVGGHGKNEAAVEQDCQQTSQHQRKDKKAQFDRKDLTQWLRPFDQRPA